jgi:hypothetical protein
MDTTSLPPCLPPSVEDHTAAFAGCVDTEAYQSSVGAASVMSTGAASSGPSAYDFDGAQFVRHGTEGDDTPVLMVRDEGVGEGNEEVAATEGLKPRARRRADLTETVSLCGIHSALSMIDPRTYVHMSLIE